MQFSLGINEVPKRVSAFGGIYRWKDGRNMPDVHAALFEYMGIPVYMRLSLDCESAEVTRFQGSKGMIELRGFSVTHSPQAGVDTAPSYYSGGFPGAMRAAYVKKWHEDHDPTPGKEPAPESITINGNDYDDLRPHLWNFFEAVRSRKPVVQDAVFGHNAALACHLANESYFRGFPFAGTKPRRPSSPWHRKTGAKREDPKTHSDRADRDGCRRVLELHFTPSFRAS